MAVVPLELEADYSEALLAFHDKRYQEVLKIVVPALKEEPKSAELLELGALTMKSLARDADAEMLYKRLVRVLKERKAPERELVAYEFELGLIYYRTGRWADCRKLLEKSIHLGFNEIPAHFFLGMMAIQIKDWDLAEKSLVRVSETSIIEMSLPAHLYLAQVHASQGAPSQMLREYRVARKQAFDEQRKPGLNAEQQKLIDQVLSVTDTAMAPLKINRFFGGLGLISSYDSNVFSDPSGSQTGGTKKSSFKETVQLSGGYASALLNTWQTVINYRGTGNINLNPDTKVGQFFQNELNFYFNHSPLEEEAYGIRTGATYTFQYKSDKGRYEPYNVEGIFGPYYRVELGRNVSFLIQGGMLYRKDFSDTSTEPSFYRTGPEEELLITLKRDTHAKFFNPGLGIKTKWNQTSGESLRSTSVQTDFMNTCYLGVDVQMIEAISWEYIAYSHWPEKIRADNTFVTRLALSWRLQPFLQWLADIQATLNKSNVDEYPFERLILSTGFALSF